MTALAYTHLPSSRHIVATTLVALVGLGGCAGELPLTNGAIPQSFVSGADLPQTSESADSRWWERFHDPVLNELVTTAASSNHDVRIAFARVDAARAQAGVATSRLLPSVSASADATRQSTNYDANIRKTLPDIHAEQVGPSASWELDLFGSLRAERHAAQNEALAADFARRGAVLATIAETARQYFLLRGAEDRLEILDELATTQRETVRLTEHRRASGVASDFDVERAQAELGTTEAAIPSREREIAVTGFRIATLTGRSPGAWATALSVRTATLLQPLPAPVSQPAELLRRRPDIIAAEQLLVAASYRRQEAVAARFPRVFLSTFFGSQWTSVNGLNIGAAHFANVGGALALPLFTGGRIQAGIDGANAREREAVAVYEQTILRSLEDVESALSALAADSRRQRDLAHAIAEREAALAHAQLLFRAGQVDLLLLLDVERGLLSARLDHSETRTALLTDSVQLYRALGGGWQPFEAGRSGGASGDRTAQRFDPDIQLLSDHGAGPRSFP
jgi:outer membrane protein, multidrug efflux system